MPQTNHEIENNLKLRFATRTVLLDADNRVAIIHVQKHGYYKIPGGGTEENETIENAARREVQEEAGCDCILAESLGRIETKVPIWNILDISDGFIAVVSGKKSQPNYENWEAERGFELKWFDSLDSAITTIKNNTASEPGMDVLQARDLTFLKLAKDKLDQNPIQNQCNMS